MTEEEMVIADQAIAILNSEASKGFYDGHEADVFGEAVSWIERAIKIAKKYKMGSIEGCIGGTFPSEQKPTTCYVCGSPSMKSKQSIIGQILFGLCDDHYDEYFPFWGMGRIGLMKSGKELCNERG